MDKVEIKGYKSFKELKLDLLPINILIGSNGSGKSNFLSFLNSSTACMNKSLRNM